MKINISIEIDTKDDEQELLEIMDAITQLKQFVTKIKRGDHKDDNN